jgi:hypothetical protein
MSVPASGHRFKGGEKFHGNTTNAAGQRDIARQAVTDSPHWSGVRHA